MAPLPLPGKCRDGSCGGSCTADHLPAVDPLEGMQVLNGGFWGRVQLLMSLRTNLAGTRPLDMPRLLCIVCHLQCTSSAHDDG